MAYIHDLNYYGGNANNQRYLESLAAAKAAPSSPGLRPSPRCGHAKRDVLAQSEVKLRWCRRALAGWEAGRTRCAARSIHNRD
jgi:hypothetical protein